MCGIVFTNCLNDTTLAAMPWLVYKMKDRGRDSWGMTSGLATHRELGNAFTVIPRIINIIGGEPSQQPKKWWQRPLLLHTRSASVGKVCIENAHPFDITGPSRRVIGIHNGGVSNWAYLNNHFNRKHDCDSPHVFETLADDSLDPEVVGMRGVAVWLEGDDPAIHVIRHGSDALHIVRLKSGELIGSSTEECSVLAPIMSNYGQLPDTKLDLIPEDEEWILADGVARFHRKRSFAARTQGCVVYSNSEAWAGHSWGSPRGTVLRLDPEGNLIKESATTPGEHLKKNSHEPNANGSERRHDAFKGNFLTNPVHRFNAAIGQLLDIDFGSCVFCGLSCPALDVVCRVCINEVANELCMRKKESTPLLVAAAGESAHV